MKNKIFPLIVLLILILFSLKEKADSVDLPDDQILDVRKTDNRLTYELDGKELSFEEIKKRIIIYSKNNKNPLCIIILDKDMTSAETLNLLKDIIGCGIVKIELWIESDSDTRVCLKIDEDPMPIFYEGEKRKIPDDFSLNDIRPGNKYMEANGKERPLFVVDLYEYKDKSKEFSLEHYHQKGVLCPQKALVRFMKALSESKTHLWIIIVNRTDKLDEKKDYLANLCSELGLEYKVLDSPDHTPYNISEEKKENFTSPEKQDEPK